MIQQSVEVQFQSVVNQPPTISPIRNRSLFEDSIALMPVRVSDPDHDLDSLLWSVESDQPALLSPDHGWRLVQNGDQFELKLQPSPDAFGVVNLKVKVQDPEGAFAEESFRLSVRPVNDPPFFDFIPSVVINPGQGVIEIPLTGISDGSDFEDQVLTFLVEVSDQGVIATAEMNYIQGATEGLIKLTAVPEAAGLAEISVKMSDGPGANNSITRVFHATLLPEENMPPTVAWVEPLDNTTFFEGEPILLKVAADDPDGDIRVITFFSNGTPVNESPEASQQIQWTPDRLGAWELNASVEDDKQAMALSRTITIHVVARPPEFSLSMAYPEDPIVVCLGDRIEVGVNLEGGTADGTVVHFFAGDSLQGVRNEAPYVFQWDVQEVGDFLLTAHAFREDGSVVVSESIRAGVSETCHQVALLVPETPVEDPGLIREFLFEMGVGSSIVPLIDADAERLSTFDMVLGLEDAELGVTSLLVDRLHASKNELNLPIYVLGHHLALSVDALSSEEKMIWRELTRLQAFGSKWMADGFELQETGFFRPILEGRFGAVESFILPVEVDRAIADESAEVIAFTGEADVLIRYPSGTEPDFGQPRMLVQNFPLLGEGGDHSLIQRKRLFQNAACWALRCSACTNAILPVLPDVWNDEVQTGALVGQSFYFMNNGACELTGGRVFIDIPEGLTVEDIEMSRGLGWRLDAENGQVILNLGRLISGAEGGIRAEVFFRALAPGDYVLKICSSSNNTDLVCTEQALSVTGRVLIPTRISIARGDGGKLVLVISGQEGLQYHVETSLDFIKWEFLGSAFGTETTIPLPTNEAGQPITLFYRAKLIPE